MAIFSVKVIIERCSADWSLMIDALIAEAKNVVLEGSESVYKDESCKLAFIDNVCLQGLRSEDSNTTMDNQLGFHN